MRTRTRVEGIVYADGVRGDALMTEEQIGELYVEITPEMEEFFRLEAARERGEPEPVLYEDEQVPLVEEDPIQQKHDTVIEIQERMAKGMVLIRAADTKKKELKARIRLAHEDRRFKLPYKDYCAINQAIKAWDERISLLWSNWWALKDECDTVIGEDKKVWAKYFRDIEEAINPYWTNGNTDRIDNQTDLYQDASQLAEVLAESHLLEEQRFRAAHGEQKKQR